jgi:hypothetical protein
MAKQMSPLRQRMIEDMTIRNMSPSTQKIYVARVLHSGGPQPLVHSRIRSGIHHPDRLVRGERSQSRER